MIYSLLSLLLLGSSTNIENCYSILNFVWDNNFFIFCCLDKSFCTSFYVFRVWSSFNNHTCKIMLTDQIFSHGVYWYFQKFRIRLIELILMCQQDTTMIGIGITCMLIAVTFSHLCVSIDKIKLMSNDRNMWSNIWLYI